MNWYSIFRYPLNKYGFVKGWLNVKWAFQRMFRGYDDRAYWGLCGYLTDIALPVLKWYRRKDAGVPCLDGGDNDSFNELKATWDKILDKMILALQLLRDEEYGETTVDMRKHEEQIKEGLALFAKHYRSLWD